MKEELEKKLNELYSLVENNKPPLTFSRSEVDYNQGLYQGQLKALEMVCRDVFGIDGDSLEQKFSLHPKEKEEVEG